MRRPMLLAEELVGEARARRERGMSSPERRLTLVSCLAYAVACALILWLVPDQRHTDPLLVTALVAGYALTGSVRFEFGHGYNSPEQLVLVPLLLLAPLPLIPILIAGCSIATLIPELVSREASRDRWAGALADSWFCIGPVIVLAALAPGLPDIGHAWVYGLAFLAQMGFDVAWSTLRGRLLDRLPTGQPLPYREIWRNFGESTKLDMLLAPIALAITIPAAETPLLLLAVVPLTIVLHTFAKDREKRYGATLELQRAYRGTVMLLADVVEFDDHYTAAHSRSVVDLVNAVADELRIDPAQRQEIEFAALLHDVGKIAVPKEILHKPARLTIDEFEVIKRHTIEGQTMLDRVGGLLGRVGEIVRSCHERWDGAGYPDGLAGERIPLAARIVFACDAYNAMTTDRIYRRSMTQGEAVAELRSNAGAQFDPVVVDALVAVVEDPSIEMAATSAADDIRTLLSERAMPEGLRASF